MILLSHLPRIGLLSLSSLRRGKKCLFVDCGSNLGQGYRFFKIFFPPRLHDAILIEPNPHCIEILKQKYSKYNNVQFIEAAAWTNHSRLKLFGLVEDERGEQSSGASVISKHNESMYESNAERALEVDAISLSDLIHEKAKSHNQIIIKMDIESSEYEVLQDMIRTGAIQHVKHLFVEFHSDYFKDEEKKKHQQLEVSLIEQLRNLGLGVTIWV